jgi:hypothetical protein
MSHRIDSDNSVCSGYKQQRRNEATEWKQKPGPKVARFVDNNIMDALRLGLSLWNSSTILGNSYSFRVY